MNNELLTAIENLLDRKFDEKLGGIEVRMDNLEDRVGSLEGSMNSLAANVEKLNKQVSSMDMRLKSVEITIENEIRPGILHVAEWHFDLVRKLNEALESDSEREMLDIRVNYLDAEVRKLKELQPLPV